MVSSTPSQFSAGIRDTVLHMLQRAVDRARDEVYYDIQGVTCTFGDLDLRTNRFGNELTRLGIGQGDTVVTIADTSEELFTWWLGINKVGGIWVPINLAYRHEFLRHQIADSSARIVICQAEYLERVVEIADRLPEVELILVSGHEGELPPCPIRIARFEEHQGNDAAAIPITVKPQDLCALIYTSGTTGPSKGCMISHNYFCMQARQSSQQFGSGKDNILFTPLPMFHTAAMNAVLWGLNEAARIAMWPRFSVSRFWEDIEQSGATVAMLMASIFQLVAKAPDTAAMERCKGRLHSVIGVPISPEIRKIWMERFGVKWVSSWAYGQTENSRLSIALPHETPPETCAGRAADEFELMIFDEDDCPVPPGTVGQIVCRPKFPNIMFEGYWRRPEATAAVWNNLWMHTGDLGRMDEDGWLYFVDRAKDYLRSRGENISSFEVESSFLRHPAIADIAAHAVSQQTGEDEMKVTIVLKAEITATHREILLWSIDNLPYFAVPRYLEFRDEIPKNPTGKVLKYQLRDEGVTAGTWDREAEGIVVRRPDRKKDK